jgi:mevalonate kinase
MTNTHNKITVLERILQRKITRIKNIFSQMEAFPWKSSGLDPLNSYLSIPILILKDNIEATNKALTEKALSFY